MSTVLIVDDYPAVRKNLRSLLEKLSSVVCMFATPLLSANDLHDRRVKSYVGVELFSAPTGFLVAIHTTNSVEPTRNAESSSRSAT
jgi:CheY-like chemotaxis protein